MSSLAFGLFGMKMFSITLVPLDTKGCAKVSPASIPPNSMRRAKATG